jgi:hypothetical protein
MEKKLYELSACMDEGYDGAINLFSAESREEVAEYMLKEIRKYLENKDNYKNRRGERYFQILKTMHPEILLASKEYNKIVDNGFLHDDYEQKIFEKRMKEISPQQLLGAMEGSYVDGDSNAQVSIHEYHFEDIISL